MLFSARRRYRHPVSQWAYPLASDTVVLQQRYRLAQVVVHQPLAIAAGKARVYFQHGKMLNRIEDTYDPYCYFSMKRPRAEMQSSAHLACNLHGNKQYRRKEQTAQRGTRLASSVSVGIGVGSNWWMARNEGEPQEPKPLSSP